MDTLAKVLTTLLAFGLFFFISKKLFWTGIQQVIDERQSRIKSEFDKIASLQKEVTEMKSDYSKRIAEIEKEAQARKQDEINLGRKAAEEILAQARTDAAAEMVKLKQTVAIEMDKARATLREEVVKMTLTATEKVLREKMDGEQNKRLVSRFVEELASR